MNKLLIERANTALTKLKERKILIKDTLEKLTFIQNQLIDGQFSSVDQFIAETNHALEIPFQQGHEFEGYTFVLEYILDIFQKELKRANIYKSDDWASLIIQCHDKYGRLLSQSPGGYIPPEFRQKFKDGTSEVQKESKHISLNALQQFSQASESFNDNEEIKQKAIKILKKNEPTIDVDKNDIEVDVTKLKESTISLLADLLNKS